MTYPADRAIHVLNNLWTEGLISSSLFCFVCFFFFPTSASRPHHRFPEKRTSGGPMYLEKRQGEERRWQQAAEYINSKRTDGKLWFLEIYVSSYCLTLIKHQVKTLL